jgi:hypothetical protein
MNLLNVPSSWIENKRRSHVKVVAKALSGICLLTGLLATKAYISFEFTFTHKLLGLEVTIPNF